jgi:hypothetical protein
MAPHETRSYYLPDDVEEQIAARTPPGWSKSAVLTRIVRRYVSLIDGNAPIVKFTGAEWAGLRDAGFGFADKHSYGLDSIRRLDPELRRKVEELSDLERMAIWDYIVTVVGKGVRKKGGRR